MVLRSILLECCALSGTSHRASDLAEELSRIVQEWGLERKIILAVSDNGSNIKCAIEKCLGWKHFNCYAHCINLVVTKALENNSTISNIIQNAKNVVSHLKKSTVAWEKLKRYLEQAGKPIMRPLQDVPTRWNSTYYMLERLLLLKGELNSAISNLNTNIPVLSANYWSIIEKLVLVLKPSEEVTKEISGDRYVTGSSVIPITIALKSALVTILDSSEPLPDDVEMRKQQNQNRIFQNHLLYPDRKTPFGPTITKKCKILGPVVPHFLELWLKCNDTVIPKSHSPLEWWKANKNSYPHLAILARNRLNSLATSVPCERLFSAAGNILSDRRTRLGVRKIKQLLFLQQNLKNKA
ncbi:unnamed protein product [Pieris macdunnoughi]|uniref:HAT C-terminal dimerisation domain-containing protein n=1 Tax=Pieris macdunnoughi TaxID=345717 RepID=A0A821R758_9NEOP|nr:unnamed protein product [Pieris macdunnoughi]